jgi:hypothetical protein
MITSTSTARYIFTNNNMSEEDQRHLTIPLSQWKGFDGGSINRDPLHHTREKNASLVRRIVVAYAVAKVLRHALERQFTFDELESLCSIDNFFIRASLGAEDQSDSGWEVEGLNVIQPNMSVKIRSKWPSNRPTVDLAGGAIVGRNVEGLIVSSSVSNLESAMNDEQCDSRRSCYLLGRFLHSFFSDEFVEESTGDGLLKDESESEPSLKKTSSSFKSLGLSQASSTAKSESSTTENTDVSDKDIIVPLCDLGYPAALSQLVTNLLDCGAELFCSDDSYKSLEEVIDDLHILLQDPGLFLFNQTQMALGEKISSEGSKTLYGRANEVKRLNDAFSRVVSTGVTEIVFVSGSSG